MYFSSNELNAQNRFSATHGSNLPRKATSLKHFICRASWYENSLFSQLNSNAQRFHRKSLGSPHHHIVKNYASGIVNATF